jgi:endoglucanase
MKKTLKAVVAAALAAVTVISSAVFASAEETKSVADMTAQEIVEDMKIGWNLGNSLDSHGSGYSTPTAAETSWGNPATTKAMIDTVKAAGFNTVRVPVTWYDKCDSNGTIDSAWFARVKEVVDYGIDNGMYVIINLHHEDGGSGKSGWLIPDYNHQASCEVKIKDLWTQIGTYFKDYDRHLIFETMNEPRIVGSGEEWTGGTAETRAVINVLNADAVEAIRATGGNNKTRLVMCPTCAAKIDAINGYVVPDDNNVAVSIHNYSPYNFAMNQQGTSDWGSDSDKAALKNEIVTLYNTFVAKGTPVVIGEMGATYKYEYDKDREPWATFYTSTAKSYGITCVVWDNNSFGGSENFKLLDRSTCTWEFPTLVQALVNGVDESVVIDTSTSTSTSTGGSGSTSGGTANDSTNGTDITAYTMVVYTTDVTKEAWAPLLIGQLTDLPALTEGCTVTVEYSGDKAPYLVLQRYVSESDNNWNQISPDTDSNGVATYKYATIAANCDTPLSTQTNMFVMGGTAVTIKRVIISYPQKDGDVNLDTKVNQTDAVDILKYVSGILKLTDEQLALADYNNDGSIDMKDVIAILGV